MLLGQPTHQLFNGLSVEKNLSVKLISQDTFKLFLISPFSPGAAGMCSEDKK